MLAVAASSLSSALGCVLLLVSLRLDAELKGGSERLEGEGDGGFVPRGSSNRGSEWVRDSGPPDVLRLGLYLGGSLNGTGRRRREKG